MLPGCSQGHKTCWLQIGDVTVQTSTPDRCVSGGCTWASVGAVVGHGVRVGPDAGATRPGDALRAPATEASHSQAVAVGGLADVIVQPRQHASISFVLVRLPRHRLAVPHSRICITAHTPPILAPWLRILHVQLRGEHTENLDENVIGSHEAHHSWERIFGSGSCGRFVAFAALGSSSCLIRGEAAWKNQCAPMTNTTGNP